MQNTPLIIEVNRLLSEHRHMTPFAIATMSDVFLSTIQKVLDGKAVSEESESRIRGAISLFREEERIQKGVINESQS